MIDEDDLDETEEEREMNENLMRQMQQELTGDENISEQPTESFLISKLFCGGLSAAILAAICVWNETLGLDLITMVLSLTALIYVWTNG